MTDEWERFERERETQEADATRRAWWAAHDARLRIERTRRAEALAAAEEFYQGEEERRAKAAAKAARLASEVAAAQDDASAAAEQGDTPSTNGVGAGVDGEEERLRRVYKNVGCIARLNEEDGFLMVADGEVYFIDGEYSHRLTFDLDYLLVNVPGFNRAAWTHNLEVARAVAKERFRDCVESLQRDGEEAALRDILSIAAQLGWCRAPDDGMGINDACDHHSTVTEASLIAFNTPPLPIPVAGARVLLRIADDLYGKCRYEIAKGSWLPGSEISKPRRPCEPRQRSDCEATWKGALMPSSNEHLTGWAWLEHPGEPNA